MTMMVRNCRPTLQRINICDWFGEPPRIMFTKPSTSTTATAMTAMPTKELERLGMDTASDREGSLYASFWFIAKGPCALDTAARSLSREDLDMSPVFTSDEAQQVFAKLARRLLPFLFVWMTAPGRARELPLIAEARLAWDEIRVNGLVDS